MAITISTAALPVPTSDVPAAKGGVPWLNIILDECANALEHWCGDAWRELARSERKIVNYKATRTPQHGDFKKEDLPALYLWPERVFDRRRVASELTVKKVQLRLMWVPPPALEVIDQERDPFWLRLDDALNVLADPSGAALDTTTEGWGTMLRHKAQLWSLTLGNGEPSEITIGKDNAARQYPARSWAWIAETAYSYDWTLGPSDPACTQVVYSGGEDADLPIIESHFEQ